MRLRLAACAAAAATLCLALGAATADASYPGQNGPIVFSKNGDIFRINVGGGSYKDITRDKEDTELEPSVSPDGNTLAFEFDPAAGTAEIFTSNMKGENARWVTKKQSQSGDYLSFHEPTWSPGGGQIAFICNTFSHNQLCVVPKKGGSARVLARCSSCNMSHPDWGKQNKLLFQEGGELWIANGKGEPHPHKLHIKAIDNFDAYGYKDPSWAPNGKKFAFTVGDTNEAIDVASADGSHHKRLIISEQFGDDPTDYDHPAWAPDGKSIALQVAGLGPSQGGKPEGLYIMKPDGTHLTKRSGKVTGQYTGLFWATK
jgi:Tol biopolymer transport system component